MKDNHLSVLFKGILKENPVFVLVLGTCPTLAMTTSVTSAVGMGLAAMAVLICSNAVISLLRKFIPDTVRIPCYIVIIAAFVTMVQMIIHAYLPELYESLCVYLALITTNCAVLGVTINCIGKNYNYGESLIYALGTAIGFIISMIVMSSVRNRLKVANVPQAFKGTPILYVAAGLLSLAFLGFKGIIG